MKRRKNESPEEDDWNRVTSEERVIAKQKASGRSRRGMQIQSLNNMVGRVLDGKGKDTVLTDFNNYLSEYYIEQEEVENKEVEEHEEVDEAGDEEEVVELIDSGEEQEEMSVVVTESMDVFA
jgi:hypothetical protein